MFMSKQVLTSIRRLSRGTKDIVAGAVGLLRSVDAALLDIRFWAEGRDWDVAFDEVEGKKGECKTIYVHPGCLYRAEKIMATDSAKTAGTGTLITSVLVGQRLQRPLGTGTLTMFFAANALGNGLAFDVCQPHESIALTVKFLRKCKFSAGTFGRALI